MFVAVLAAETDETRQAITMLILGLVGIAVLLSLLTVWYWRFTNPKRRALALFEEMNQPESVTNVDDLFEPADGVTVDAGPETPLVDDLVGDADGGADGEAEDDGDRDGAEPVEVRAGGTLAADRDDVMAPLALVAVVDGAAAAAERIEGAADTPTFDATTSVSSGAWLDAWSPEADDELTRARRRRSSRQDVLSDDDWAAAMRSAFDHYRP